MFFLLLQESGPSLGLVCPKSGRQRDRVINALRRQSLSNFRRASFLKSIDNFFYEAACCQAPFSLKTSFTPSVVNRASGFLKREACICLERTSIRASLFLPDTRCCIRPTAILEAPGTNASKKVPTQAWGFGSAHIPGVTLHSAPMQRERQFLTRITHNAPGCASFAN